MWDPLHRFEEDNPPKSKFNIIIITSIKTGSKCWHIEIQQTTVEWVYSTESWFIAHYNISFVEDKHTYRISLVDNIIYIYKKPAIATRDASGCPD